ncbi:histidine phosphatase superfamily [Clohesyomyces aquaticus]|uniref:Histidine phosphatase superfamily n=1 Tax=Clohesyomyces aquaticus TaxID=1231657 RepID=A0A1Y2A560_9PLEO|nr:histidine phosphatase superfamily [Clohesyomyces aquaticus]
MQYSLLLPVLSLLIGADAAETVLGAYIFHRHGDRTPKSLPPANLTTLGYDEVYTSGQYYRSRYLTGSSKIRGINKDIVKLSQLSVTSPVDNVLQSSAVGFLQGLYPPVGETMSTQSLANGSDVQAPMNGYQLIPVNIVSSGTGSEDNGWLQDASGCQNAKLSSNAYFSSAEYNNLLSSTKDLYKSLVPVVNGTFDASDVTFKNAYVVYDLINVAEIHNSSIPSSSVLTPSTLSQIRTLADAHEFGLAYNASDDMRAMPGMQLAGEILKYMNSTITSGTAGSSANKFGIQFGAYASFLSFFGLAGLPKANVDFTGVPDYASSMVFELFTTKDVPTGTFPTTSDLQVRFLFHNGTASNSSEPTAYPLFGGSETAIPWTTFSNSLSKFAVKTTEDWCTKCGNTTGTCAAYAPANNNPSAPNGNGNRNAGGSHMSAAVGGVIGAFVTLAVVLGGLAAFMLLAGFRLVSKQTLAGGRKTPGSEVVEAKA